MVPLRDGLRAYSVLSLEASVAYLRRGSHNTYLHGAIVLATTSSDRLMIPTLLSLVFVKSHVVLALPADPEGTTDCCWLREGAKAPHPSVTALLRAQTNTTPDESASGSGKEYVR